MKIRYIISIATVMSALVGCGSIYSPTLNLPYEPLQRDHGQFTTAASALPQVGNPNMNFAGSGEAALSYGFSDRFSLQLKAWDQGSELIQAKYNGGSSLSATILLTKKDADVPVALIPSSVMLVNGNSVSALGGMLECAVWLHEIGMFRPYLAGGGGILSNSFRDKDWGYGVLGNAGVSAKFSDNFRMNFEIFGGVQRYLKSSTTSGFLAPTLSVSWAFDNRE